MLRYFIFQIFFNYFVLSAPKCTAGKNYCSKCNYVTNICSKCLNSQVLAPDANGGCSGNKKCILGLNYCQECDESNTLCKVCDTGLFPDENGGCSYSDNCEISYLGDCLICKEYFFLVENKKICKSINSEDFNGCEEIDKLTGFCKKCEDGYYLNGEDKKCSETENCGQSINGKCIMCNSNYYLDYEDNRKCKYQLEDKSNEAFIHCLETEDGKTCSKCEENYYFDSEKNCINTDFCSKSEKLQCIECIDDYFLTKSKLDNFCVSTDNCFYGDGETGLCSSCQEKYYIDLNDGKCKSNQEDDDLKYCKTFSDKCEECSSTYMLSEDGKCSQTLYCKSVENGICLQCIENYFIVTKNHKCVTTDHCIDSSYYSCTECDEGYTLNQRNGANQCIESKDTLIGCKKTDYYSEKLCKECKKGFYLNGTDNRCYSNEEYGRFYKCERTNYSGKCSKCIDNYYLGDKDNNCSPVKMCSKSENGTCIECRDLYCLDNKQQKCIKSNDIKEVENNFYFNCKITNDEGNKCETCMEGYNLSKNGFCINIINCIEMSEEEVCQKCVDKVNHFDYYFCANMDFGCVKGTDANRCMRCDGINFDNCTECFEGYKLQEKTYAKGEFKCVQIEENEKN